MKKIGIIVPWDTPFMWTAPAFNMMNWERPDGYETNYIMGVGWCPAARHNDGVAKAQAWNADYIMFNGGDHLCEKSILKKMVKHLEKWDMVHAPPPSRGVCSWDATPFRKTSYKVVGPIPKENTVLNASFSSMKVLNEDSEPQESHICGTGNVLMKAEILEGLQKPYFEEFIKKDNLYGRYCVMDSDFVKRCTIDAGARMFFDPTIEVVHLDAFGIDETFRSRFKDKENMNDWSPAKDIRKFV